MALHKKLIATVGAATLIAAFAVAPAAYAAEGDAGVDFTHIDPGNGQAVGAEPDLDVSSGGLSFDEVDSDRLDSLHFNDIKLTGSPVLTGLRIPPFAVIDATGTEAGWHVNLTMGDLIRDNVTADPGGPAYTIPASGMSMTRPTVLDLSKGTVQADDTRSNNPAVLGQNVTAFDGDSSPTASAIVVATNPADGGDNETGGTFMISPSPLRVVVPSDALSGHYDGTIDLDLVSGP
jgi:hypothetical protein